MNLDRVPAELRALKQWVLWKVVDRDGEKTKVPFQANGLRAKSNDPSTWASFDECRKLLALGSWSGIGFMFSDTDPYCGIDLDGCRNPETGRVAEWAKAIVLAFGSYAEVSPSRTGIKIWARAAWKHDGHKMPVDEPSVSDKNPAIEIYDRLRYFAVTGDRLQGCIEIVESQDKLEALHAAVWVPTVPPPPRVEFRSSSAIIDRARKYLSKLPVAVSGQGGHGATFHAACVLCLGFELSTDDALGLLLEWNSGCQPPWSEKDLRHKVEDAARQTGERGYLKNVAPQNFGKVQVPSYLQSNTKPAYTVTTVHDAAKAYLDSVSSCGDRLIGLGIPELDYAIGGGAEAGELFLLAARPSHGKSALAMQMVHHWTNNGIPTVFVSEEMSSMAIGKRAVQFATDIPQEHWSTRMPVVNEDIDKHFFSRAKCTLIERCKTADAAAEAIRQAKRDDDVKCAVVDYAQLLGGKGNSRYEQITDVSICLKQITSETNVLLVALCQLSRQIEGRDHFIPRMSDLKETGQLEQDADVIVFGVWPHRIDSRNNPYEYQLFVAKNRNRPINAGSLTCRFEPSRQMFIESPVNSNEPASSLDDGGF